MATYLCPECGNVAEAPSGYDLNCGPCLADRQKIVKLNYTIDLTPKGVKENPERVNKAMKAKEETSRLLLNRLVSFFNQYHGTIEVLASKVGAAGEYDEIVELIERLDTQHDELLRAVAGQ